MATRLLKGSWWVDFGFKTRRIRKRSPINTRAGAKEYEAALRLKLARGEEIDQTSITADERFEQFAWRWHQEYVVPNNKYSEQRTKKYVLASSLIPFFGRMRLVDIKTLHIEQYKAKSAREGVSNKTINNRLAILSKCIRTAYEWYQIAAPPPRIALLRAPSRRTDYLTDTESEALLRSATGVVREMLLAALRTGMRQGELKGLQWESINWEQRAITVCHSRCDRLKALTTTKTNRERYIPLDTELYELLARRRQSAGYVFLDVDGAPFDWLRLDHRIRRACKIAGIRRATWHVLRHTFATQLAMKNVPLPTVKELLGHSSIATTMRYAHATPSSLRSAIDLLGTVPSGDKRQPGVNQWQKLQEMRAA